MAEGSSSIMSWRDKYLAFRTRHQKHLQKAGETTEKVGSAIVGGAAAFAVGVADQKWGAPEAGYANLGMVKVGPVPLSLLLGAAGLGMSVYGSDEKWAGYAEAGGLGAIAAYSNTQARRMTIDWEKQKSA